MDEAKLQRIEERWEKATSGPWVWTINNKAKRLDLMGYGSYLVMDFIRWGMSGAIPRFRNSKCIMQPAHEFSADIPGREHHASWCQTLDHPDAIAIQHAPEDVRKLISEVRRLRAENERLSREHATYAEIKTDRNLELKERVDELTEEVERLRKQRSDFEQGIRI